MWRRAKVARSAERRASFSAVPKTVFAAVLLVLGLAGSAAEACPEGKKIAQLTAASQKIERVFLAGAVMVSAAPSQAAVKVIRGVNDPCCGAGCHAHGVACGSGCCGVGFVSSERLGSSIVLPERSTRLSPLSQAETASARPPPDFRPPRTVS